jgi:hypothetical protein
MADKPLFETVGGKRKAEKGRRSSHCFSALIFVGKTRFELATPSTPY